MKVIYDISHQKLNHYIQYTINQHFPDAQEISYHQSSSTHFIFKQITSSKDVQTLKKYRIPQHTLVAIIKNPQFMFELLEYYPLCYIRIDHIEKDLQTCLSLMENIYNKEDTLITFKVNYSYIQLRSSNILYIESFDHYLIIYTKSGEYQVRDKLSRIKAILEPYSFVQIHRSYLINKKYIQRVDSQEIILSNSTSIPIGEKYKSVISAIIS